MGNLKLFSTKLEPARKTTNKKARAAISTPQPKDRMQKLPSWGTTPTTSHHQKPDGSVAPSKLLSIGHAIWRIGVTSSTSPFKVAFDATTSSFHPPLGPFVSWVQLTNIAVTDLEGAEGSDRTLKNSGIEEEHIRYISKQKKSVSSPLLLADQNPNNSKTAASEQLVAQVERIPAGPQHPRIKEEDQLPPIKLPCTLGPRRRRKFVVACVGFIAQFSMSRVALLSVFGTLDLKASPFSFSGNNQLSNHREVETLGFMTEFGVERQTWKLVKQKQSFRPDLEARIIDSSRCCCWMETATEEEVTTGRSSERSKMNLGQYDSASRPYLPKDINPQHPHYHLQQQPDLNEAASGSEPLLNTLEQHPRSRTFISQLLGTSIRV
ncbi:hypothetical protein BJ508DRAFT_312033 [Ascobolus immersus RN42]|uniref:Uncharacterized protein n=1 Tax=Ascobolus immersus RN42 TaxID=1160509 RepID=A0A3N4HNF7_ASCIM|nr:hypothetical protein BJ508DRAFT_312033 [Ascobolus immersus RN42]